MTKSISDKLLKELYFHRSLNEEGMTRITEIIPDTLNWRIIAADLYGRGLIEFNPEATMGACAKLTDKGVVFCEKTSFLDPHTPVIELEDL